jgi:hypothetical protein
MSRRFPPSRERIVTLFVLAYLGGVLTIISPCILPVLPFVFARADRSFARNGLPMLAGMALTFAGVASFAAVAGGWVVEANQYGRIAALVLMAAFGLTLVFPELTDRVMRPLVSMGAKLSASAERDAADDNAAIVPSLLLGVATGFLWAGARPHSDRSGSERREHWHFPSTPRLRGGRVDVAGACPSGRRPGICRHEASPRRGRVGQARLGHCRIDCRGRSRIRARYRVSNQGLAFQHSGIRAETSRSASSGSEGRRSWRAAVRRHE